MVSNMASLSVLMVLAAIGSLATATYFDTPLATAALIGAMLGLIIRAIPLNLAWDQTQFGRLLRWLGYYSLLAVGVYAAHYYRLGVSAGEPNVVRAEDAVYLSVATWTTTGVSDLTVPRNVRWLVSVQSLNGIITIAVTISMLWLWCEERLALARKYVKSLDKLGKRRPEDKNRLSNTNDA